VKQRSDVEWDDASSDDDVPEDGDEPEEGDDMSEEKEQPMRATKPDDNKLNADVKQIGAWSRSKHHFVTKKQLEKLKDWAEELQSEPPIDKEEKNPQMQGGIYNSLKINQGPLYDIENFPQPEDRKQERQQMLESFGNSLQTAFRDDPKRRRQLKMIDDLKTSRQQGGSISHAERQQLKDIITQMPPEYLSRVEEIVRGSMANGGADVSKEIDDLGALDASTLRKLQKYVGMCMLRHMSNNESKVIDKGAVQLYVSLLSFRIEAVREHSLLALHEHSLLALGKTAGDSCDCRDVILKHNGLQPILNLCNKDAKVTMLRNATWTISNFCRGKPQPDFRLVAPALQTLSDLVYSEDSEVLADACWALSYLSDDTGPENEKIQAVIEAGVCRRLVELLMHESDHVKKAALRTVGNIVTGDDIQTQVILNCSALPCLLALLSHPNKSIRKETCWTISNITAGNVRQIECVKDANIIPSLVDILRNAEFDIKKEAAWAIVNAICRGSDEQIRYLVHQSVIAPLCDLFKARDPEIIMMALEGIESILRVGAKDMPRHGGMNKHAGFVEECGGLDLIEELQRHENVEIFKKAVHMLQIYFIDTQEDDMEDTQL